ncbi:hypothetical protein KXD40_000543 [Peronospora effusa]|nr:hypothetical protein KXD40_000543 [Peronospora effusa]
MYANDNLAQSLWITFVKTGDKARAKQFEAMQKVLPSHYNDEDALIKDLVTDNGSHFAKRLLEMQMKIWTEDEKTAADVSWLLDLGTTKCMISARQNAC